MSSLSEQENDNLNPNEPAYYAPRWLRDRSDARPAAAREAAAEPMRNLSPSPASLDTQLEKAVSNALWHPLDPEVIHEPPGLAEELDRGSALITVAGRFAAAVGVSAIVALFFVIMVPASRLPDNGGSSGIMRSIKSALLQPGQRDDTAKSAISEFQPILAAAQSNQPASQPAAREQSDQLLQQFMQWRQKPNSTETTQ
ncbi:MAG: hypothetical protein ACXU84_18965 [Xanthobacteraceae bacterium]|jgi:hypothetical protein